MQLADNAGATDEHRAMNYLAVRYDGIYALAHERFLADCSLVGVDVRPSRLSGPRTLVQVVFRFRNRKTDVDEQYYARVDVTEEYPFLQAKLQPYFDRQ
jgi:hypothetical protein